MKETTRTLVGTQLISSQQHSCAHGNFCQKLFTKKKKKTWGFHSHSTVLISLYLYLWFFSVSKLESYKKEEALFESVHEVHEKISESANPFFKSHIECRKKQKCQWDHGCNAGKEF
jgi:hypothetical protein